MFHFLRKIEDSNLWAAFATTSLAKKYNRPLWQSSNGVNGGFRSHYLWFHKPTLSRLSYTHHIINLFLLNKLAKFIVAGPGFEPGTSAYETDEITNFYASRNINKERLRVFQGYWLAWFYLYLI